MRRRLKKLGSEVSRGAVARWSATVLSPIWHPRSQPSGPVRPAEGVIKQRSDYGFDETIVRMKADIATEGHPLLRRDRPDEARRKRRSRSTARPCSCSAIPRSAYSSCSRTPSPDSTGRCACSSPRTTMAPSGSAGPTSASSPARYQLRTAIPRSRWRAKSPRFDRLTPQGNSHENRNRPDRKSGFPCAPRSHRDPSPT